MNKKKYNVVRIIFRSSVILTLVGLIWVFMALPSELWIIGGRVSLTSFIIAIITGIILNPPKDDTDTE